MDYNLILNIIKQCLITELRCDNFESKPDNGIISFEYKQLQYYCVYAPQDPAYVRIILPNIDNIREGITPEIYQYMLRINGEYKVAKIAQVNDSFWLAAEIFLTGTSNIPETIVRMVNLLYGIRQEYATFVNNDRQKAQ